MLIKITKYIFIIIITLAISSLQLFSQNSETVISLKNKAIRTTSDLELIAIYIKISKQYFDSNKDSALFYIEMAQILADKSENDLQKAIIFNFKGDLYREYNNFEQSITVDERALEIAKEIKDSILICDIYNDIGVTYRRLDYDSQAIKYHLWAYEIARQINDRPNLAKALNNLGIIYFSLGRYEDALKHYNEALLIEIETNNLLGQAINYNSIAEIYQRKEEFERAIELYNISIEVNIQNNSLLGVAICNNDLGYTYFLMGEYKTAKEYYTLAYNYFKDKKKYRELAYNQLKMGNLSHKTKSYSEAIRYYTECERLVTNYRFRSIEHNCYLGFSETYEKLAYFSLSLQYSKKALEVYKMINKEEYSKISAELEAKYQIKSIKHKNKLLVEKDRIKENIIVRQRITGGLIILIIVSLIVIIILIHLSRKKINKHKELLEKKNFEILSHNEEIISQKEQINKQNNELNSQKNELEDVNASKDLFFSIIAHDLRNPFNAFLSLSEIILESYETLEDEEIIEMVGLINESAENAYRLLENLLIWAKSQKGALETKPETFSMDYICEEVLEDVKMRAINKNIDLDCNNELNTMVFADKNMIMTIIRNLLSNAIKFTPSGGKVKISTKKTDNKVEVSISDTGIGISPESIELIFDIDKKFTRKGTNNEGGSGLGLILCKDFIEKNNGTISIKSEVNLGSTFTITIPSAE